MSQYVSFCNSNVLTSFLKRYLEIIQHSQIVLTTNVIVISVRDLIVMNIDRVFYFLKNRMPRVLGPQWVVMVDPAVVSKISSKTG